MPVSVAGVDAALTWTSALSARAKLHGASEGRGISALVASKLAPTGDDIGPAGPQRVPTRANSRAEQQQDRKAAQSTRLKTDLDPAASHSSLQLPGLELCTDASKTQIKRVESTPPLSRLRAATCGLCRARLSPVPGRSCSGAAGARPTTLIWRPIATEPQTRVAAADCAVASSIVAGQHLARGSTDGAPYGVMAATTADRPFDVFASTPERPYLPTPPQSDRDRAKDMASAPTDGSRTATRHPNGTHEASPTKHREDRPQPLDLDAAIGSAPATGGGSFTQTRGRPSPKPLDLLDVNVQPPSAGATGRTDRFSDLPPTAQMSTTWSSAGDGEAALAARRQSYQSMETPATDLGANVAWPFPPGLAPPPTPGYAPKSPSAIHPSYGIPHEADEYADADRPYPLNGRASPNDVENAHAYAGAPPLVRHASRNGAPARPFYQPSLNESVAGPPSTLARRLDSAPAWITYYFFANLALTLYNKFVLVSFPYAWSLTAVHTLCGAIGARALLSRGAFVPARLGRAENLTLIAFSSLYTINIAVSNLSLNLVTVPFHQVVRAMTPLFTIVISAAFLGKRYERKTFLALVPVIMGVGFATYGDYYFTAWGLILTLFGTFLAALKTVTTNIIMVGRLKLHPLDLLLRMSPLAFVQCVACAWYTGELERVRMYGATQMTTGKATGLLMNGTIAFLLNIVSFSANKKTNALTMTVAANVKQVLTILLAVVIFNLHVTGTNLVGIVLTLVGGAAYATVELQDKRRKTTPNLSLSSITTLGGPGPLVLEKSSPVPDNHEFASPTVVR